MAGAQETGPDAELRTLQEEWAPGWMVWRVRRSGDPPGVCSGEFVAARTCGEAGAGCTVMRPTAVELDAVLRRRLGLSRRKTVGTRLSFPVMWAQE